MSDITHPELVSVLVKPPVAIINTLSIFSVDLWHGATGVAGEAGELLEAMTAETLDIENIIEECGDLEFYMEQIRQRANIVARRAESDAIARDLPVGVTSVGLTQTLSIVIFATQVLDTVKKCAVYNKQIDLHALEDQLFRMDIALTALYGVFGLQREVVLAANIGKLSKRYASMQYSDAQAQARADKVVDQHDIDLAQAKIERKFIGNAPARFA